MRSDINDFNRANAINLIARNTLYKSTGYVLFDCSAGAATPLCCVSSINIGTSLDATAQKGESPQVLRTQGGFLSTQSRRIEDCLGRQTEIL